MLRYPDKRYSRGKPGVGQVLETRKTAPGLRLLDKWAVLIGGGTNHRIGLYDMIMIKDNHIAACGSLRMAVQAAQKYVEAEVEAGKPAIPVEVETRTLEARSASRRLRRCLLQCFLQCLCLTAGRPTALALQVHWHLQQRESVTA